ncbi:hypothetical protein [Erythrobacter sp.]|uniref:hypothetical protein n=1 Tax=Erythrobacter sp. TaxID=1042 RepID=UPI001B0A8561|nr:hypothetical protein [Erythrobacter sp.]MBO6527962.1 hypothetical protein [Erythrobacter sp.]MBO6528645.1 hypothetical protein [Erythrobacter sp.]
MSTENFIFAVMAPALALALHIFSPLTSRFLQVQAERIALSELGGDSQVKASVTIMLKETMAGASALASLAPTLVSFVISGFAIFISVSEPFWWVVSLAIGLVLLAILVVWMISGRSIFELQVLKVPILKVPRSRILGWITLLTNFALIGLATAIWQSVIA